MVQIDVVGITPHDVVKCNLYTGERCVNIYMDISDYQKLITDGFFIRDGKSTDSANVINTTHTYKKTDK